MRALTRKSKTAFTLFKDLPPEIRHQIWVLSLPGPRIIALQQFFQPISRSARAHYSGTDVSIHESQHTISTGQTNNQESVITYRSQNCFPTIYSVCWESRAVVEQFYTKAFQTMNSPGIYSPGIWIDFERDSLYLAREICQDTDDTDSNFYIPFGQDIKHVKHLTISGIWSEENPEAVRESDCMDDIRKALQKFGNLELLMLADAQHEPDRTENLLVLRMQWAKEYMEWYRWHAFPALPFGPKRHYSWPWFAFGILIDESDIRSKRRRGKGLWRRVHAWKKRLRKRLRKMLRSVLTTSVVG